jgi:hypothetical protein
VILAKISKIVLPARRMWMCLDSPDVGCERASALESVRFECEKTIKINENENVLMMMMAGGK